MPKKTQDATPLLAVVQTPPDAPDEEVTNINATAFCPFINHKKRDYMPRYYPTGKPAPNHRYHYWQTKNCNSCSSASCSEHHRINPRFAKSIIKNATYTLTR
jgi:hypothetical protein